jgi:hypothetical protein
MPSSILMDTLHHTDGCILLQAQELLQKFRAGKIYDKTFSRLYARWLGILTPPGFVFEIRNGKVAHCYRIAPEIEDFPVAERMYAVQYDFRMNFKTLEQWMKGRKTRPRPVFCRGERVAKQIEESLDTGYTYIDDFFLIVSQFFPDCPVILSTANREITYVESSEGIGVMHGAEKVRQCILQDATYLVNELNISKENLTQIVSVTRKLVALIGGKTTCEFIMVDDTPYLITAQRTSSKRVAFPAYPTHNSGLISIGPVEGTAKWVDKASLSETVTALPKKNEKYVFLAEKPCSEFIDLLPFAKGFLFKDGSMLCHLATLLREREIPARILHDGILRYKDDDTLALK